MKNSPELFRDINWNITTVKCLHNAPGINIISCSREADNLYIIIPTLKHDGTPRSTRGQATSRSIMAVRSFGVHAGWCDRGKSILYRCSQNTNVFQLAVFLSLLGLYNYFLHPIAHIKGPFLAAVTPVSLSNYSSLVGKFRLTDR